MKLDAQDVELFYKLNINLLFYVKSRLNLSAEIRTLTDFIQSEIPVKADARDRLYENIQLIDEFYEENPAQLTEKELGIVLSWKNFIQSEFIVYKQYKKYCVFIQQNKEETRIYAVLALASDFNEVIPFFPCHASTVLLPFRDSIIYDGIISPYNVFFGSGIVADLKELFEITKARDGIIARLPYTKNENENRDADLLRFYLKSDENLEYYEEEIDQLINKDRELLVIYHQELGKRNGRKLAKSLKKKGVSKAWFAVYDDTIVASGPDKKSAEENVNAILSEEDFDFIHLFKI